MGAVFPRQRARAHDAHGVSSSQTGHPRYSKAAPPQYAAAGNPAAGPCRVLDLQQPAAPTEAAMLAARFDSPCRTGISATHRFLHAAVASVAQLMLDGSATAPPLPFNNRDISVGSLITACPKIPTGTRTTMLRQRRLAGTILLAALACWLPTAQAKAFTWSVDRNGELITLPVDASHEAPSPPAANLRPSAQLPGTAATTAHTASSQEPDDGVPSRSTLGLLAGLGLGGSYVFGWRLYRWIRTE